MLQAIKRLFEKRASAASEPASGLPEHTLRLAAAALVFEVVRADGAVAPEEAALLRTALQGTFGLTAAEAHELAEEAKRASRSAVSLYEFTHLVDRELDAGEKKRIVELLWLVADGCWVLVGSANWDPRSLRLNFEFNLECYDTELASRLTHLVETKKAGAELITLEKVDQRGLPVRLMDGVARLLMPYL